MVRNTSSGGGLPTCQIWKAYLERQKSYSPDTICCGCRGRFDLEVKGHQQWYMTHRLEVVYLHAKYEKPVLNNKNVTAQIKFVMDARTSLTLRSKFKSKVANNGTRHISWRWSTYMPNMKSLPWTTKKLQPGHNLLRTHRPVWPWGQRSPTMVRDTLARGGLPTCQIWKACLERQKSYSPDTICYGCTDQFDLEVKVQGQRSPTMVRDTSAGGGLPTCQIWKACLERQKSYSPDTICYGRTDQFDLKVKGHQQWYATHRLEVVYLHAKYEKPVLNDKKVTARTQFVMDARPSLTLRSKVTNNGTQHIVWRWSTYMPNMQSLSWTTKNLQPGHDLLRTHRRWDGQTDHYRGPNYLSLCMRSS